MLDGVGSKHWLGAVLSGAIGYAFTLAGAIAALVLVFLGGLLSGGSSMDSTVQEYSGVDPSEAVGSVLFIIGLPFQFAGMALMGTLKASLSSSLFGMSMELSGMLWLTPLLLTAVAAAALWWLGRRAERKQPATPAQAWILSAATGLALSLIALLLGLLFTVRAGDSASAISITSVSVPLFFGALVIGTLSTRAGRAAAASRSFALVRKYPEVVSALKVFGLHFAAYTVVTGVVALVAATVKGGAMAAFSAPLWLPTAAAWMYGVGHFSSLGTAVSVGTDSVNVFDLPWWATLLLVLFTLALAVTASVVWALVRGNDPAALRRGVSWVALPAAFLAGGLVVALLSAAIFDVDGGILGFSGTVGLAPWTFLIMALWGGAIEVASRFVAPVLIPLVPWRIRGWLARRVGPSTTTAAGMPAPAGSVATGEMDTVGAPSAAASSEAVGQVAAPRPLSAQAKKRLRVGAIIAGAAVVLAIGATVAYNVAASTVFGPQAQVEKYLDALRDGDAATAVDILDPNVRSEERVLLTNEVFSAAENRISGYEIRDVEVKDEGAVVKADLTQDSKTTPIIFSLEKGDRTALVFNEWRVVSGGSWSLPISIPKGSGPYQVNGVDVELSTEGQQSPVMVLPVLPGSYVITPPDGTKYVTLGEPQTVNVPVDLMATDGRVAEFQAAPTDAVQEDAVAQAKEWLTKCMSSKEAEPESCPNQAYTYGDAENYRNFSWKLTEEPTYEITSAWDGKSVYLEAIGGQALVTYERNVAWYNEDDPAEWEKQEDIGSLYFSGEVKVDGDKLTVDFSD